MSRSRSSVDWEVPAEHFIEPWDEALRHERPESRTRRVLLFRDEDDFHAWLQSPATFDLAAHTVSLHLAAVTHAGRKSA